MISLRPYYKDDDIVIYNADCREVLADIPDKSIDLVLTDPPYGINAAKTKAHVNRKERHSWKAYEDKDWDRMRPAAHYFEEMLRVGKNQVIWGGNYFADFLPPSMGWLSWDKCQRGFSLADFELAWTSFRAAARCFQYHRGAAVHDGKCHPTQKPLALMLWCLEHAEGRMKKAPNIVLDPFMGSGTTLVAAKQMGRAAVGVELDEQYCEIAAKRLAQGVLALEVE